MYDLRAGDAREAGRGVPRSVPHGFPAGTAETSPVGKEIYALDKANHPPEHDVGTASISPLSRHTDQLLNFGVYKLKRFNLVEHYDLSESIAKATDAYSKHQATGIDLFVSSNDLPSKLDRLVQGDNELQASKHIAKELSEFIRNFINAKLLLDGNINPEAFNVEFNSWEYSHIYQRLLAVKTVYLAECRDLEVYSVDQVSIYKTSNLVASASSRISSDLYNEIPNASLAEFDEAGKCLAFRLPTACGFHALRGLELMMSEYLAKFTTDANPKSWFDYIKELKKISDDAAATNKPSPKVIAMLDRMRVLDRNPLMHPQDRLDTAGADMLFNLSAITVSEMARDLGMKEPQGELPLIAADQNKDLPIGTLKIEDKSET